MDDDFPHCKFCGCTTLAPKPNDDEICSHACRRGIPWGLFRNNILSIEDIDIAEDEETCFRCRWCSGLFAMEHYDENWFWTNVCKFCTKHAPAVKDLDLMKG